MRAYKFLDAAGRAPFTGMPWRPGTWVETGAVTACRMGVHACRPRDLARWLSASLWEVELDGDILESGHKVAAARGRLVRRIDEYGPAVRELAAVGAWRSRDRAVDALRAAGDDAPAARLEGASRLQELATVGTGVDESTFGGAAAALAADAAHFALHGTPAQSPFVAACSAGHAAAGSHGDQVAYDRGYGKERAFQSTWLAQRLGLS